MKICAPKCIFINTGGEILIVFLKKSSVFLLCITLLCAIAAVGMACGSICVPASENASFGKTVIIDAGHGDPDGGAVGSDGTTEAQLNLSVALKLDNLLSGSDIKTVMTRATNEGIHDKNAGNISEKKKSDMRKRREIQQNIGADIFVSIHMNQFSESKYHGAQVVYDAANENAKTLAECIQTALKEHADPENNRQIMKAGSGIYLLKNAAIPSVIVECGFISNENELSLLKTDEYQSKIAWAIYKGIEKYYETLQKS